MQSAHPTGKACAGCKHMVMCCNDKCWEQQSRQRLLRRKWPSYSNGALLTLLAPGVWMAVPHVASKGAGKAPAA